MFNLWNDSYFFKVICKVILTASYPITEFILRDFLKSNFEIVNIKVSDLGFWKQLVKKDFEEGTLESNRGHYLVAEMFNTNKEITVHYYSKDFFL